MTDTQDTEHDAAFPSDAAPQHTVRKQMRPFGADAAHALMVKNEAIRTLPRQEAFDRGYLTVQDLDDEELRYGKCRDENGYIPKDGKKTILLPKDKYDEMIAEHELRFRQKLRQNLDDMLVIMVDIAKDDTVEPRDRFEAAKYLFERTAGKTPDTVNVTIKQAPYEELLNGVTGIGSISRAEHRRMAAEGPGAGIIDVEYTEDTDEDAVQQESVPFSGQTTTESHVVSVHKARPDEQSEDVPGDEPAGHTRPPGARPGVGQKPDDGSEPDYHRTAADTNPVPDWAPTNQDQPDPLDQYGSKRTEAKSYGDQVREANALAERRKAAKDRIRQAKKGRIIARTMGADAIETDITGATVDADGKLQFE